jgi:hypothetical protein
LPQPRHNWQQEKPTVEAIPEHRRAADAAAELKEMEITLLLLLEGDGELFRDARKEVKDAKMMKTPDSKFLMNLTKNGLMTTVKLSGEITKGATRSASFGSILLQRYLLAEMLGSEKSTVALPAVQCLLAAHAAERIQFVFTASSPMLLDTQYGNPLAATTPLNLSTVMSTGMVAAAAQKG